MSSGGGGAARDVVDQIRALLRSADQTQTPALTGWAATYAEACRAVNDRLGRCGELLSRGRPAEAVAQAEIEPKLLDLVAQLDFPERGEWDQLAFAYGLPGAPALRLDLAEGIHDAYAQTQPLDQWLRRHRRLALDRAPLAQRIEALRQIAARDTGNPVWSEDLRSYELAFLKNLRRDFDKSAAAGDLKAMLQAQRILLAPGWSSPPPESIVNHVRAATARGQLATLGRQLERARQAGDVAAARAIKERWEAVLDEVPLPESDPARDAGRRALHWLDQAEAAFESESAYQDILRELERALDLGTSHAEFALLEREALAFGRGLPPELYARWEQRRAELRRGQGLRRGLALGMGVAVVLFVLWLGMLVVSGRSGERRARDEATALRSLIDQGQLAEARGRADRLDADLIATPQVVDAVAALAAAEDKDKLRQAELDSILGKVPATTPGTAQRDALLRDARALARRAEDVRRIDEAARGVGPPVDPAEMKAAEAQSAELAEWERRVAEIEQLAAEDPLGRDFEAALARWGEGPAKLAGAEPLAARVTAARGRREAASRRDERRAAVTRAVGEIMKPTGGAGFADALAELVKGEESGSPRALDLQAQLNELANSREAALAWCRTERDARAGGRALVDVADAEATTRLERVEALLRDLPRWPGAKAIAEYKTYLEAIKRRVETARPQLEELYEDRLVSDAYWVRVRADREPPRAYYLLEEPGFTDLKKNVTIRPIADFEGNPARVPVQLTPALSLLARGPAPQQAAAKVATEALGRAKSWEEGILRTIADLRSKEREAIDPVLRWSLTAATASFGAMGSAPLEASASFRRFRTAIEQGRVDAGVLWMVPDDAKAKAMREKASLVYEGLPDLAAAAREVAASRSELERGLTAQRLMPAGWLSRDAGGERVWRCLIPRPLTSRGVAAMALGSDGRSLRVGRVAGDGTIALEGAGPGLREGALIYVVAPAGEVGP